MIVAVFVLLSLPGHAAEVASGAAGFLDELGKSPVPLAANVVGGRTQLPVTFVAGFAGRVPRGACELESGRNADGSAFLTLSALKTPLQNKGFFDYEITIPARAYPLRAGWRFTAPNGDALAYDGFKLIVRTSPRGGGPVTRYEITVDSELRRVTRVDAADLEGTGGGTQTPVAAVGCDPALG